MSGQRVISKPAHRVYHGIADSDDGTNARILVMDGAPGPTERKQAVVLYPLTEDELIWWGYTGGSPSRTADAILEDVLPDVLPTTSLADRPHGLYSDLSRAFCQDFLAYFHDPKEFWLPARTIARWTRGFLQEAQSYSGHVG